MTDDNVTGSFGFRPEHVVDIFLRGSLNCATPTLQEVQTQVEALLVGPFASLRPQLVEIVSEILHRIDVRIGAAHVLDNPAGHEPWLESVDRSSWRLWPRL